MSRRSVSISEAKHEKQAQTDVQTDGNSFDVYGNEEAAESEHTYLHHRRQSYLPVFSKVPHHGVVESRRTHACGDGITRCTRSATLWGQYPSPIFLQILSIPSVFATIGLPAGIILVIVCIGRNACRHHALKPYHRYSAQLRRLRAT